VSRLIIQATCYTLLLQLLLLLLLPLARDWLALLGLFATS
jgi:hypothetical protein